MLPKRRNHKRLGKFVALKEPFNLLTGKELNGNVLCALKVLPGHFLNAAGYKAVGIIVGGRRIAAEGHNLLPLATCIAGLLKEFPFSRLKGSLNAMSLPRRLWLRLYGSILQKSLSKYKIIIYGEC